MGSKKKKGAKAIKDNHTEAVQPAKPDMSKYARAVSNKSKINYADLKLVRHDPSSKPDQPDKGKKKGKGNSNSRQTASQKKRNKPKKQASKKPTGKKNAPPQGDKWIGDFTRNAMKGLDEPRKKSLQQSVSAATTAEERYSSALGSEDHYSSAVEKYYLKYPNAKRPKNSGASYKKKTVKRKRRRAPSDSGSKEIKPSMAEIAARNKSDTSVRKHARSVKNGRARGVVSSRVGNRSFYRRKKKRSGALNVLAVTALLLFLSVVCVAVFFNVKQIRIVGDNPYSETAIMEMCSFGKGSNILFIDTASQEQKIMCELPYIEQCSVERRLPSTIVIKVTQANMLGIVQAVDNQWSVISDNGKILETGTAVSEAEQDETAGAGGTQEDPVTSEADGTEDAPDDTVQAPSVSDIAESKNLPVLTGLDMKLDTADGFVVGDSLKRLHVFSVINNAAGKVGMKLSAISWGKRGYEAEYDKRLVIIFGEDSDEKTIAHRMKEVYELAVENEEVDRGEIRFNMNKIYFRPSYEISTEALEKIQERRKESTRKKLYELGEIFMATGYDWYKGKLKTE